MTRFAACHSWQGEERVVSAHQLENRWKGISARNTRPLPPFPPTFPISQPGQLRTPINHSSRIAHDPSQSLLLLLSAKDDIDALPRQRADLGRREVKVFGYEAVLIGQGAAEDAHVVGLVAARGGWSVWYVQYEHKRGGCAGLPPFPRTERKTSR